MVVMDLDTVVLDVTQFSPYIFDVFFNGIDICCVVINYGMSRFDGDLEGRGAC